MWLGWKTTVVVHEGTAAHFFPEHRPETTALTIDHCAATYLSLECQVDKRRSLRIHGERVQLIGSHEPLLVCQESLNLRPHR